MSNIDGVRLFVSTTLVSLVVKIVAALIFGVVGRWLIDRVISLVQRAMNRNHVTSDSRHQKA